jgi:hypothetical protein
MADDENNPRSAPSIALHPANESFPMMTGEELEDLAESIKAHRLFNPIVLDKNGVLLDGKCRLRACELAGVEPRFETFEGFDSAFPEFGLLGDARRFARVFRTPIEKKQDGERRAVLSGRVKPFLLITADQGARRRRLPPKTEMFAPARSRHFPSFPAGGRCPLAAAGAAQLARRPQHRLPGASAARRR